MKIYQLAEHLLYEGQSIQSDEYLKAKLVPKKVAAKY